MDKRIIVGITGASGSIYAERLIDALLQVIDRVYLVVTSTGQKVIQHELKIQNERFSLVDALVTKAVAHEKLRIFSNDDMFAPIASGSAAASQMIILPCSMGTMSRVASGQSTNLLERAADVMLKQSRPLVICPRESPLNRIHLTNMLALSDAGATIMPAMPCFYDKPKSIEALVDTVVGRVLDFCDIENGLFKRWNSRMI
ncbi:MAG: flavin prenyltransferase UbiX [Bdellovibrionota bacterium]